MDTKYNLPLNLQVLHDEGCQIRNELIKLVEVWPTNFFKYRTAFKKLDDAHRNDLDEQLLQAKRWLNTLGLVILPHSLYGKEELVRTIQALEYIVRHSRSEISSTKARINEVMNDALSLIKAIPTSPLTALATPLPQKAEPTPRTAFILMWMDPSDPELDDVCNAIKEVCAAFGVYARRADDLQHQDRITDVVLHYILNSEFLIADLTGARPNVYYEVGYAHALNKKPILYRKHGTMLHFDLSVHNVPEYKNITELKDQLKKRFEAILGQKPRTQFR